MNPAIASIDLVVNPILPVPVVALIGVLSTTLTTVSYFRVGARLGAFRNSVLATLRIFATVLVVAILLQPSRVEQLPAPLKERPTLVALDTSASMREADVDKTPRLDAARNLLRDAGLAQNDGLAADPSLRFFEFADHSTPVTKSVFDLQANGTSTRIHRSLTAIFNTLATDENPRAVILLSDGHDFDLINPARTGFMARNHQSPIYAVALGKQGKVRDVAVHITSYQPYCYVRQKARITAALRLIGCEYEDLELQLVRQNEVVQTRTLNAEDNQQQEAEFEVTEPAVGQYEYEIRAVPLEGEVDKENNSAITYLNVIDQQIQVLLLEGSPYWDTSFLQRSLMRNEKIDLDLIAQYGLQKAHAIRKRPNTSELKIPSTAEEFNHYDVVILGRSVDKMINRSQLDLLTDYVRNKGGTVIFSRGRAFDTDLARNELEPVVWTSDINEHVRLQAGREGQSIAPFKLLNEQESSANAVPDLIAGRDVVEKKPLTATLASTFSATGAESAPGIVQRRFGQGQVVSVGVDGLWRWAFNSHVEGVNTLFDRFWDQMILWLVAGRDILPNRQFSLRTSSANILLGEKAWFRVVMRSPDSRLKELPIILYRGDREVARTSLNATPGDENYRLSGEYLPESIGKYRAVARFPDSTTQESKFIVYSENLEETEVATDVTYLKRLCESSGGRLLLPEELPKLVSELRHQTENSTPKIRLRSIWDKAWIFYAIGLLFGLDWYLRRRWGLC